MTKHRFAIDLNKKNRRGVEFKERVVHLLFIQFSNPSKFSEPLSIVISFHSYIFFGKKPIFPDPHSTEKEVKFIG